MIGGVWLFDGGRERGKGQAARAGELWAMVKRSNHVAQSRWLSEIAGRIFESGAASVEPDRAQGTVADAAARYRKEMD